MYFAFIKKRSIIKALSVLLASLVTCITLSSTGAYAVFYNKPLKKLPIYYVKTEQKKIAISFDCAWGVDYTDKLLEIMEEFNVKCTFFMVEFWAKKHPEYVKKIHSAGHEIGTHSATHPHMAKLKKGQMEQELLCSMKTISDITGTTPIVFRPPYGEYNDTLIEVANNLGLYTIQWDVDSLDWKDLSEEKIYDRVCKKVKNGSIVLFHNQGLNTSKALPKILKTLIDYGYSFESIGNLIYKQNYQITADGGQAPMA